MGVFRKTIAVLCLVVFVMSTFFLYYYLDSKDYLAGKIHHYSGTSEITAEQLVSLGTKESIGGNFGSVSNPERLEGGLVKVDYGFYSEESYSFLSVKEISYIDTPLAYTLMEVKYEALGFCVFIAVVIIIVALMNKYNIKISDGTRRKVFNCMWYLMHPKHLKKRTEAESIYNTQLQTDIKIDLNDPGILCVRTWKYKGGYLYSTGFGQAFWDTPTLLADTNPEETNERGIYAYRLGTIKYDGGFIKDIIGIVSLRGTWYEHADGVLRAERCDILHLIVSEYHRPNASNLSSHYGLPVTVADNPINKYLDWLLKSNGLDCMIHNSKIMEVSHGDS